MLYRFRLFLFVGLFILAGCLPGSASPSADQAGTDRTSTTGIPSNQIQVQAQTSSVLTLAKSANPQSYSQVGQTITYTFVITNMGTTPLGPTQFVINDNKLTSPLNCGPADTTLAPNQSITCTASYPITQADMAAPNVTNTATATGAGQTSAPASVTITNSIISTATATQSPTIIPTSTATATFTATSPIPVTALPEEYRTIQFPQQIIDILNSGGYIVPLPQNPGSLAEELTQVASNFELSRFDLSRIVHFPPALGNEYIAVPVRGDYFKSHFGVNEDFTKGVLVGLIYDKMGAYRGVRDVYEIWAFENHVYLYGRFFKNAVQLTLANNEYYWRAQDHSLDIPLAVFIKNGCWLCWGSDSRCGCLICR